jgi:DNA-binding transcriptional regulator YiaG
VNANESASKIEKELANSPLASYGEASLEKQLDEVLMQLLAGNTEPIAPEAEEALNKLYPLALSLAQNLKTPQEFQELLNFAELSVQAGHNQPESVDKIKTAEVKAVLTPTNPTGGASEVIEGINALRKELERLAGHLEQPFTNTNQPDLIDASIGGELNLTVLGSLLYQAVREALSKNTFQSLEGSPWPTARLEKGNSRGQAQLRPAILDNQPLLAPQEIENWSQLMWKQREELSDLDADALDLLSHIWLQQARSPSHYAVGDVDQFLAMRGLKPKQGGDGRRGGYEPEQRAEMLKALSHIQNLWLNMGQVEVAEPKSKRKRGSQKVSQYEANLTSKQDIQSKAFIITDRIGQLNMDGYMDVRRFIFQPGHLFAHYLFGPGRQVALLSAKAIQYDPYRQKWEKRLARYLSWQWRSQAQRGDYLRPYQVASLLETIGEAVNERYPSKTRERLEKALDALQNDGVISGWQYDQWDETATARRGWINTWQQATLLIEPPDSIKEAYTLLKPAIIKGLLSENVSNTNSTANLAKHSRGATTITPETLELVAQIKRHRKKLRLSQLQVAEHLKIAQSYFSKLESGHVNPSTQIQKRLQEWLANTPDISS